MNNPQKSTMDTYTQILYHIVFSTKYRTPAWVKNQQLHHQKVTYQEELKTLLREHGIRYDKKYFS